MTTPGPIDHVQRPPLPWRAHALTECGLPAQGHPVITREAFIDKVKKLGQQRAAMTTCMTCFNTALRHPTFEENPAGALVRECEMYRSERAKLLNREMRALAALVSRHRDEFEELMQDQAEIVPIRTAKRRPRPTGGQKW